MSRDRLIGFLLLMLAGLVRIASETPAGVVAGEAWRAVRFGVLA